MHQPLKHLQVFKSADTNMHREAVVIVEEAAQKKWLADWATADRLATRALPIAVASSVRMPTTASEAGGLIAQPPLSIGKLRAWAHAGQTEWLPRMACVSLLKFCRRGELLDESLGVCELAVHNGGRFSQLGVGWLLREVRKHQPQKLEEFVARHGTSLSREALMRAVRGMEEQDAAMKRLLMNLHHRQTGQGKLQ